MNILRELRIASTVVLITLTVLSARARVKWIERDHDFGLMKEIAGPKTGFSRFVNMGPDTISIFNVRPSCGCTSADWSKDPLAPGDTAVVSYTYDPTMRPGKFDKSVKVQLSDGSRHAIRITGNVLGTPESLATLYPLEAGYLRLSEMKVDMGEVSKGHNPIAFVNAYCLAQDTVIPRVSVNIPGLRVTPSTPKAGPGDLITYTLEYSLRDAQYGPLEGEILFSTDDEPATPLPWKAYVLPNPDLLLRAQQGKNPYCEVSPQPVDFGMQPMGNGTVEAELTLSNTGNGPLEIYRIVSGSEALKAVAPAKPLKPGKKTKVIVTLDTDRIAKGPARIPLTLITNDPAHTRLEIPVAIFGSE